MTKEMRALFKLIIKEDLIFGLVITLILFFINPKNALIFLLGIIIALGNFILRGIILDKSLNAGKPNIFTIFGDIIRILLIVLLALCFSNNIYSLLSYLAGFIVHFPILIFGWIKSQKGSD